MEGAFTTAGFIALEFLAKNAGLTHRPPRK